jgi:hypothetical protein
MAPFVRIQKTQFVNNNGLDWNEKRPENVVQEEIATIREAMRVIHFLEDPISHVSMNSIQDIEKSNLAIERRSNTGSQTT